MNRVKDGMGFLLAISLFFQVHAQQLPKVKFDEQTHKFGSIREIDGPVTHEFKFTNTSNDTIVITGVKASCGCTTPGWSKEAISPGEKGFVKAQYNPRNRPGPFKKSLTVNTSAGTTVLYIEGNVKPKPRTPKDEYPSLMGNLRLKYKTLNFGKITNRESVTKLFSIYNDGEQPITFKENSITPEHVSISIEPKTLQPKQKGELIATFDPTLRPGLGYSIDHLMLITDDPKMPEKKLNVMATVEEFFQPMTNEEYKKAPHIVVDETVHDFGDVTSGDIVRASFNIFNNGGDVLNLRKVVSNCSCTVSKPEKEDIQPGTSTDLNVTFDSTGKKGTQHKTITIYSNDPRKSVMMLTIKASVKEARN